MLVKALIIATSAITTLQADQPIQLPGTVWLTTADGLMFDIRQPCGSTGGGTDGAFNGFGYLQVNGQPYRAPGPFGLIIHPDWGKTLTAPPMPLHNGLTVSRKIYVPYRPGRNYIRYLDTIRNDTPHMQAVLVQFFGFSGLGNAAVMRESTNEYVMIGAGPDGNHRPPIGVLMQNGLRHAPDKITDRIFYDAGLFSCAYLWIQIKPHSRLSLVHYVVQGRRTGWITPHVAGMQDDYDDVQRQLEELLASPDFDYLDSEDLYTLWNFFIDTDVNMDGHVNVLDLIVVRNDLAKTPESASTPRSDVNNDLSINILDLIAIRNDLGWQY
ncbi:MAG: hypothetical protein E4H01_14505 [Lysobacterales bacterium]|nr:MAG: hypothetical protein E4H01_14505 [Xanthomonadales bacterium]